MALALLLSFLKITVAVYLVLGIYLYAAQRSFIYFAVPENPAGDIAVEYLDSDGERLKVWVIDEGRERAVLYFGGNAEDVYFSAAEFRRTLPGYTVYLANYRGYGGSTGSPSQRALFADALNIYDMLEGRHAAISAVGRSLGSGIAVYLASQRPLERLVLSTPYDSALAIAQTMYPIYPMSLMLKDSYRSVDYATQVRAPTLLLLAGDDRIVPAAHSIRLAGAFVDGVAERVVIAQAGHNDLSMYPGYWDAISRFLDP